MELYVSLVGNAVFVRDEPLDDHVQRQRVELTPEEYKSLILLSSTESGQEALSKIAQAGFDIREKYFP